MQCYNWTRLLFNQNAVNKAESCGKNALQWSFAPDWSVIICDYVDITYTYQETTYEKRYHGNKFI